MGIGSRNSRRFHRKPFDNFFRQRIRSEMKSNAFAVLAGVAVLALSACSRPATASGATAGGGKGPAEQRYPLRGEIVSVDTTRRVLVVKHEEIKGYMPAMTMEFGVSPGD